MPHDRPAPHGRAEARSFWLLAFFLVVLWIAGGASRPDVAGQVLTRGAAWLLAAVSVLLLPRPDLRNLRVPALILGAAILLVALQLVPLPPAVWQALPGRDVLAPGEALTGARDLWRPLSISPGWTRNALGSLVVPAVCLGLLAGISDRKDVALLRILLALIVAGCLLALVQVAGRGFDHPLLNDVAGQVSGNFANRNHLALFAAIGCLLAPVWAARDSALRSWAIVLAAALVMLFLLVILATGSRSGLILGVIGTAAGVGASWSHLRTAFAEIPRKRAITAGVGIVAAVLAAVTASFLLGKAAGVNRALELTTQDDARLKALPTVLELLRAYFPVGCGFGTFDPAFRIYEGDSLLGPSFFNQAHNDLLQVGIGGGVFGFALLFAALAWAIGRGVPAWTRGRDPLRRAGSAILLLLTVASAIDYPARTPMIMALIMIAAAWLSRDEPAAPGRAGPHGAASVGLPTSVSRI